MRINGFKGVLLSALMITSIMVLALPLLSPSTVHAALTSHAPIFINGNAGFTAANGVVSGSGTENDPYIIENWDISAENAEFMILINETTEYFVIRNCYVHGYGIFLDTVINGRIDNNIVENNNYDGIELNASNNNTISSNTLESNESGILFESSNNNLISSNIVRNNSYEGIGLHDSDNNIVSGNTVENNAVGGIGLNSSNNNIFSGNIFINDGLYIWYSYQNTVENNTVNGKPLVYLEGASDLFVADAGQVILVSCENITVENLNLQNAILGMELWKTNNSKVMNNIVSKNDHYGIYLADSDNNLVENNTVENNSGDGMYLLVSDNNIISGNTVENNSGDGMYLLVSDNNIISSNTVGNNSYGIYFQYTSDNNRILSNTVENNGWSGIDLENNSNNNLISGNTVENNYYGIYIDGLHYYYGIPTYSSNYNSIFHNNIVNNTNQAYDNSYNYWDNGYPSGGNYWSDYADADNYHGENQNIAGGDGIGDTTYPISGGINRDRYPLMSPWPCIINIENYFHVQLLAGWNLVSFTALGDNDTPYRIFTSLNYYTDYYIYYWNAPGGPYALQDSNTAFRDNTGYWVWIDRDYLLFTTGAPPTSKNINLVAGWNLVGFPITNENTIPSNIFTGLTYFTDYFIYHWTAPGGPYSIQDPNGVLDNNLGYWVWIDRDWTVTVP